MFYWIIQHLAYLVLKLLGRIKVIGAENVPRNSGVILAANHSSYADPPMMGAATPRPIWFMAKIELLQTPLLGALIRRLHAFPVRRGTADRQALRTAHDLLTRGEAVLIFYEGGRSPDGCLQPPALGAGMIALRAEVPVVPVAIVDADRLMPREGGVHFARVKVVYGKPISFAHLYGKHADRNALQEVGDVIAGNVAELMLQHGAENRVPAGYPKRLEETKEE